MATLTLWMSCLLNSVMLCIRRTRPQQCAAKFIPGWRAALEASIVPRTPTETPGLLGNWEASRCVAIACTSSDPETIAATIFSCLKYGPAQPDGREGHSSRVVHQTLRECRTQRDAATVNCS